MTGAPPELLDTWITGGLATGGLLTAHAIPQAQPPTTSYTYQWYSNAVLIVGATSQTYLVVAADSGLPITCAITPINPQGAGPTTVTPVGVTVPAITHWVDDVAGLDFAQAVAADKPLVDSRGLWFDGAGDVLLAGNLAAALTSCTVVVRGRLPSDVTTLGRLFRLRHGAMLLGTWSKPPNFGSTTEFGANGRSTVVYAADGTYDASDAVRVWTWDGGNVTLAASYTYERDGVPKVVTAIAFTPEGDVQSAIGGSVTATPGTSRASLLVVYGNAVLGAAGKAAALALANDPLSTLAAYQSLGPVAVACRPGSGWS